TYRNKRAAEGLSNATTISPVHGQSNQTIFPPSPLSSDLKNTIITEYCDRLNAAHISEQGCTVCGLLTPLKHLQDMSEATFDIKLLHSESTFISRQQRHSVDDKITCCGGPVLEKNSNKVCQQCLKSLQKGKVPRLALVNANWIGPIPPQLKGLSWIEKMIIARVSHNRCIVRVHASGQWKMKANAVFFSTPTPKIF
ncbi:hypothetical protein DENSPDRAFT_753412, partial [Dentipellis sp. KUC8613]